MIPYAMRDKSNLRVDMGSFKHSKENVGVFGFLIMSFKRKFKLLPWQPLNIM